VRSPTGFDGAGVRADELPAQVCTSTRRQDLVKIAAFGMRGCAPRRSVSLVMEREGTDRAAAADLYGR